MTEKVDIGKKGEMEWREETEREISKRVGRVFLLLLLFSIMVGTVPFLYTGSLCCSRQHNWFNRHGYDNSFNGFSSTIYSGAPEVIYMLPLLPPILPVYPFYYYWELNWVLSTYQNASKSSEDIPVKSNKH